MLSPLNPFKYFSSDFDSFWLAVATIYIPRHTFVKINCIDDLVYKLCKYFVVQMFIGSVELFQNTYLSKK